MKESIKNTLIIFILLLILLFFFISIKNQNDKLDRIESKIDIQSKTITISVNQSIEDTLNNGFECLIE